MFNYEPHANMLLVGKLLAVDNNKPNQTLKITLS